MKIRYPLCSVFLLLSIPCLYSQGVFYFVNYDAYYGIDAPVFDAAGVPLYGTNYLASLYAGPTQDTLVEAKAGSVSGPPLRCPFTFTPNDRAGYFISRYSLAYLANVPPGGMAWVEVRAWDARLGNSYEDVVALGDGGYGSSELIYRIAGEETWSFPLIGLQSFSLVPEPSLALLFPAGLLLIVCAKRWKVHR